jgi:hypothetical protein
MSDNNKLEDILKDKKSDNKGSEDELAILKIFNGEDIDDIEIISEDTEKNEDVGLILEDGDSLFLDEEDIGKNNFDLAESELITEITPIESPVEVSIESEIENNDILEEFLKKENQVKVDDKKITENLPKDDFYTKSFKDEGSNKKIHKVKNIIDSFLELFISKSGKSVHISSKGELFFVLDDGNVEKEINNEFNYKSLDSFLDYICSRIEMDTLGRTGVLKKLYNYRKKTFRFYMFKSIESISVTFELIEDIYDSVYKIIDDVPFNLMFSPFRGAVNIISGFKAEYSQLLCSIILEKYITGDKNVILLYEDDSFSFNTSSFHFSRIKLENEIEHILNSVCEIGGVVLIYASVTDKYLSIANELAYAGKNVFFITSGKNSAGDIIEFFLYNMNTMDKRKIFAKYLNSVISLGLMKKGVNNFIPVYDFLYIDRKLKRNLFEGKMDVFFREISEDSGDRIIRFDKILNTLVKKNIIEEIEAEDFVRSFSWTIE